MVRDLESSRPRRSEAVIPLKHSSARWIRASFTTTLRMDDASRVGSTGALKSKDPRSLRRRIRPLQQAEEVALIRSGSAAFGVFVLESEQARRPTLKSNNYPRI